VPIRFRRHGVAARIGTALALGLCGCNGGGSNAAEFANSVPATARAARHQTSQNAIEHVVIVVQENRSFNNLLYGFPGATTAKYGLDSANHKIALRPIGLETTWDLDHSATSFFEACDGSGSIPGTNCRMNGFDQEWVGCGTGGGPPCPNKHPQYSYVPHSETKPYFDTGEQYVVSDQMYASNFDASSFISHQYIIAGQAVSSVNYPWSTWGCPGGSGDEIATVGPDRQVPYGYQAVCFEDTTLGQEADDAGVSWAFYTSAVSGDGGLWSAYQANRHVYDGPDWHKDVITPQTRFFSDIQKGKLRQISWITPTCENSDHAGCGSNTGPSWVTSLVNAVGESKYWDSTVMFIFWDDYGGWYDPQPPAYVDYDGLGLRIPMIVVTPYAKRGCVSHVHYEHGSILKFTEDVFGLPRLAASDARANSPAQDSCFNFGGTARAFKKIAAPYDRDYFLRQPPDLRMPDTQ